MLACGTDTRLEKSRHRNSDAIAMARRERFEEIRRELIEIRKEMPATPRCARRVNA